MKVIEDGLQRDRMKNWLRYILNVSRTQARIARKGRTTGYVYRFSMKKVRLACGIIGRRMPNTANNDISLSYKPDMCTKWVLQWIWEWHW